MDLLIKKISEPLSGEISLSGSKSISNRLLIIQALAKNPAIINGLASADDTQILQKLLEKPENTYDVHHAGTSFRFLCSYLCMLEGDQTLTGSSRMLERPIKPLVDALRKLGASIEYLKKEGYPPLNIGNASWIELTSPLEIDASVSSQFISSLLLVAPVLPYGLKLRLVGNLVSRPYIEMTLGLMSECGIAHSWDSDLITIEPQEYNLKTMTVEADWSAASYYYGLVSAVPNSKMSLHGLMEDSFQGDSEIQNMAKSFGVDSEFVDGVLFLRNNGQVSSVFEYDFLLQPDLAQTISVMAAANGVNGLFSGLQTLSIKETDRIAALKNELAKFQVYLSKLPTKFSKKSSKEYYMQEGLAECEKTQRIKTYQDHRMAMSFAILAANTDLIIEDAEVVSKSYPNFWEDLQKLGIMIEKI